MPLVVAAPPQSVPSYGHFDYVTVDQRRDRVYAAHTSAERLLIVDGASGRVRGQVDVGPMHGVAVEPITGDVFTGNGTDQSVSKVDPVAMRVIATVNVPGNVDAIAYDPVRHRVYADQDGGPHIYVIDGRTMRLLATLTMPADDLESPSVDPATGVVYQNLANGGGFAIIDPRTMRIVHVVKTPQLVDNHPLVFSPAAGQVIVGGKNGLLSAYTAQGAHIGDVRVQPDIDQCNSGSRGLLIACAGKGIVTIVGVKRGAAPTLLARLDTGHRGMHTVDIDEATGDVWVVWADASGEWVQRLNWRP